MEVRDLFQQSNALLGLSPRISVIVEVSIYISVMKVYHGSLLIILSPGHYLLRLTDIKTPLQMKETSSLLEVRETIHL